MWKFRATLITHNVAIIANLKAGQTCSLSSLLPRPLTIHTYSKIDFKMLWRRSQDSRVPAFPWKLQRRANKFNAPLTSIKLQICLFEYHWKEISKSQRVTCDQWRVQKGNISFPPPCRSQFDRLSALRSNNRATSHRWNLFERGEMPLVSLDILARGRHL